MEILLGCCVVLTIIFATFLSWQSQRTLKSSVEELSGTVRAALELIDKQTVLLSTKDPLAYQAVQVMGQTQYTDERFDPSDEAELRRLRTDDEEEGALSDDDEREFLQSIGADFS